MVNTFQNSAQVLSIGIFFTLMIIGLASTLPATMSAGLQAHGVAPATAHEVATLPPVSILFAAFLGYNPIQHLVGTHALSALSAHNHALLTGREFFPNLISGPFQTGLREAFGFAIAACLIAAGASMLRGGKYEYVDEPTEAVAPVAEPTPAPAAARVAAAQAAGALHAGEPGRTRSHGPPRHEEQHAS
jgi:hypothetical protein